MQYNKKKLSINYFKAYKQGIKNAKSIIIIISSGVVSVQIVTNLGEVYPEKKVMLIYSRDRLMQLYYKEIDSVL